MECSAMGGCAVGGCAVGRCAVGRCACGPAELFMYQASLRHLAASYAVLLSFC